jgi:beta-lactamase regulating signal transducer with metallopeptidase domain
MLAILAESALRSLMLGSAVWVGLHVFRVRNPHVHMTSWAIVLLASLAMPLLMHWTTVTVPLSPSTVPLPVELWSPSASLPEPLPTSLAAQPGIPVASPVPAHHPFDWSGLATALYVVVAGLLLLRLTIGLHLTWRLARHAAPLRASWVDGADVRVSPLVSGPVTFGSTILFPSDYGEWDLAKRQAVLAHESAHVANRDFYLLLLAALNRALFWFSPFAWWQSVRLAELAELISDARALEIVDDKLSYAQILLELVQHVRQAPAGLQMARACTVRSRVERILDGSVGPGTAGWRKRLWTAAATTPVVIVSALTIAWSTPSRSTLVTDNAADAPAVARSSESIDFYAAGPSSILAVFHDGDQLWGQLTWQRKFRLPQAQDGTVSYPSTTGPITWTAVGDERHPAELILHQHGQELRAVRIAMRAQPATAADASASEGYLGWYELDPTHVLTVTRDGNRIAMQGTGRSKSKITPDGGDTYAGNHGHQVIFLRNDQGVVTQLLHYEPGKGARLARRIDAARVATIQAEGMRRITEAPDRFRGQAPMPGTREAVLRGIADLQNGTPNYDQMTPALRTKLRSNSALMSSALKALGAVETIFFRGVGPGGYDIYGLKFANGLAEIRVLLSADGKADDVIFRPDGDATLGFVLPCSREANLKPRAGAAPVSVYFYNDTGADMQLFELDADGKRIARGTIGRDMSSTVLTTVDMPWVVADASGACLQVVLPGLRTRFNTVEGARGLERWNSPRTTPLPGSEEMLRQYIEALARGQPNYNHMTAQVAAFTREQLPLNQAILSRLGALQAISFRGISGSDNDIYMAHFANGTAEWRIGLNKDRTIGRIALGPQY